ncbi:unnamed protein product, partial [Ranitomeya imitator]
MADYALRILKRDPRIIKMMTDDDYWLACLLDPCYKWKLQNIMPHENLEQILATKQATLVDRLSQAFPVHSGDTGISDMAFSKRFASLQLQEKGIDIAQFEQDFLAAHNKYRKLHGSPPLQLSRDLCKSAQKWADHLLSIQTLQHSGSKLGENLYYKSSSKPKDLAGHEPVDSWYSEIENYDFSKPGFSSNTGHFTQVVWKDSKEVGFGLAMDGKKVYFLVAQYSPAGNITNPGYYERNVLPCATTLPTASAGYDARVKPESNKEPSVAKTPISRADQGNLSPEFGGTSFGSYGRSFRVFDSPFPYLLAACWPKYWIEVHSLSSIVHACARPLLMHPMILFALAAAAWHWLLQDIVPVYQIKGISKLVKLCLPKVQCFCDSLTSPPSERQ